jgi:hypothetical protein
MLSKEEELYTALEKISAEITQIHAIFDALEITPGSIEDRILVYKGWLNGTAS